MRVVDHGLDWIEIKGEALPNFLDHFVIVDAKGKEFGKITGFVAIKGKTMAECIEASLPAGCTLVCKPLPIEVDLMAKAELPPGAVCFCDECGKALYPFDPSDPFKNVLNFRAYQGGCCHVAADGSSSLVPPESPQNVT